MRESIKDLAKIDNDLNYQTVDDNGYTLETPIKVYNLYEKEIETIGLDLTFLDFILSNAHVQVYKSKHNSTGYEMLIGDGKNNAYFDLTEEQYNKFQEKLGL